MRNLKTWLSQGGNNENLYTEYQNGRIEKRNNATQFTLHFCETFKLIYFILSSKSILRDIICTKSC